MPVVDVKVVVFHLFIHGEVVEENEVSNQKWLERVIQVRNQLEIVNWHKSDQLHVLNQRPKWQISNISTIINNSILAYLRVKIMN